MSVQKVLCWIFSKVYSRWLWSHFHKSYDRVVYVRGWRTARTVSAGSQVQTITPMFKIGRHYI